LVSGTGLFQKLICDGGALVHGASPSDINSERSGIRDRPKREFLDNTPVPSSDERRTQVSPERSVSVWLDAPTDHRRTAQPARRQKREPARVGPTRSPTQPNWSKFAFDVDVIPVDSETDEFSIDWTAEFAAGGELKLDTLIDSLGPHALKGAGLTGNYDNEPWELAVAPTAEAGAIAVSRHRLNLIKPLIGNLTTEDRESFAALLQEANG
jgi:hypothetical protein